MDDAYPVHHVRAFRLGESYDLPAMKSELADYWDILLGREDPPFDHGIMTMMEFAEAVHARGREMEAHLLDLEAEGVVLKGSMAYKFRTGSLRSFIEATKRTIDLGSRRVTYWKEGL